MLIMGIVLFVLGIMIAIGAFIFAAVNMGVAFTSTTSARGTRGLSIGEIIGGHLGAMVAMAVGGFVSVIGCVLIIIELAMKLFG